MEKKMRVAMMHPEQIIHCGGRFGFGIILFFILSGILYSQSPDSGSNSQEIFLQGQQYQKKLRFQKFWKDFMIFYDNEHQLYYLKYRLDRWDYTNDEKIKDFVESVEYMVEFKIRGSVSNEEEIYTNSGVTSNSLEERKIREVKKIYYGEYKSHKDTQVELIRY